MSWHSRILAVLSLVAVPAASAQLIPIRTVPVFQSQQFDFFPSLAMAMGGVSLAIEDSLLDPVRNPAKGSRIRGARFFTGPAFYRVENGAGAGRTLPFGALARSGTWYGGLAVAVQGLRLRDQGGFEGFACPVCADRGLDPGLANETQRNRYVFATLGKVVPGTGLSIGGSASWAGLHGIQSIDQVYAGGARIDPDGSAVDLRLGVLKEWKGGRSLTGLLLHNRFNVTQTVLYVDPIWDPGTQAQGLRPRIEDNVEQSRTWGLHLEYVYPLKSPGWRVGWVATTNLKSHPKIPTYRIPDVVQSIWDDPGHSQAFNLGVGIARVRGGTTLGADLIYEPIWSHTWADAEAPIGTFGGGMLAAGEKTVENWFRFSNGVARLGLAHEFEAEEGRSTTVRVGLAAHSISYSMSQKDHVQSTARGLRDGWIEWTPTWGVSARFTGWELHYRGSVTGTEILRIRGDDIFLTEPDGGGNILAPTTRAGGLEASRVTTHQISVSVPIR